MSHTLEMARAAIADGPELSGPTCNCSGADSERLAGRDGEIVCLARWPADAA